MSRNHWKLHCKYYYWNRFSVIWVKINFNLNCKNNDKCVLIGDVKKKVQFHVFNIIKKDTGQYISKKCIVLQKKVGTSDHHNYNICILNHTSDILYVYYITLRSVRGVGYDEAIR